MFRAVVFAVIMFVVGSYVWAGDMYLIEFSSKNYDQNRATLELLVAKGVVARHIFPPQYAIVDVLGLPERVMTTDNKLYNVFSSSDVVSKTKSPKEHRIAEMFRHLVDPSSPRSNPVDTPSFIGCIEYQGLGTKSGQENVTRGDSLTLSLNLEEGSGRTAIYNRLNGQYMIGYIAVGIYLMESVGPLENWYAAAEQKTFNKIVEGLDWLAQEAFDRGVKVVWVYAPMETITTLYEPINGKSMPYFKWSQLNWIFDWLDDIYMSHSLTDEWDGAFALANKLRKTYKTNWAVEIAVVMDDNDADNMFSDTIFAYVKDYEEYNFPFGTSEYRSPIVVMTYNNNGWGPDRMNTVLAHEVSHIFGASDEYYNPPFWIPSTCKDASSCGHQRAFLAYVPAVNGNCKVCNSNSVSCYMRLNAGQVCSFTPAELGWRDLDGNGAADPVDLKTQAYCWISPVAAGDLLIITTWADPPQFINSISVTDDMLCGSNHNYIFWDGSKHSNDVVSQYDYYAISKNGGDLGTFPLQYSSAPSYAFTSHYFNLDTISYRTPITLNIRHTIYDSLGNIHSRPRFDVMTDYFSDTKTNIYGYEDGIYISEVFGWRSDGASIGLSTVTFINYTCADMNNDGARNADDLSFLVAYLFGGGPPSPHMASMDLDCLGGPNVSDITAMVWWLFQGGPEPSCCHTLP